MLDTNNANILVVDDNPRNLQVVGGTLEEKGYQLAVALSGIEAIDYLKKETADLILLDIMMPDIDGYDVCKLLKENKRTRNIPVIFLTANDGADQIARGLELGAVDYVTKPFNPVELMARIKTHLELSFAKQQLLTYNARLQEANKDLQKVMKKLELAAKTDPLTALLNRRSISRIIKKEMVRVKRSGKPFSIILADIDDFKKFNDDHGHDCGDFVLKSISQHITKLIREQDSVARWGGEEFLLFLPETDLEGAVRLSERIRSAVDAERYLYDQYPLAIQLTMGVAVYTAGNDLEKTIKLADRALYQGKARGKNCVVVSPGQSISCNLTGPEGQNLDGISKRAVA